MRFYFIVFFALFIFQTKIVSADVDAEQLTLNTDVSENGYNKFCTTDAKKLIDNLNLKSAKKIKDLSPITAKIDALNARKNIIRDLTSIRDKYLESLALFTTEETKSLNKYKSLLKGSLTLSAVSMMIKAKPDAATNPVQNVEEMCKISENLTSPLCKHIDSWHLGAAAEVKSLNQTLANFQVAYNLDDDKAKMNADIETIYGSIDKAIAPDVILKTMLSSKTFIPLLAQGDRDNIVGCLNDKLENCKNLMNGSPQLPQTLRSEMNEIHQDINENLFSIFQKDHDKLKLAKETKFKEILKKEGRKIQRILAPFKGSNNGEIFSRALAENYKNFCDETKETFSLDKCEKNNLALIDDLKSKDKNNQAELAKLNEQLTEALNKDGSLESFEKLKKYIGDKYVRNCSNPDSKAVSSNLTCLPCLAKIGGDTSADGSTEIIDLLGEKLSSIIGELNSANALSNERGQRGSFSKDELKLYVNQCENTSITKDSTIRSICSDVYRESSKIAHVKEAKEWDDFNRKYWVEYNAKTEKGYDVYEKKSNARIFGEGLSQSINKVFPIWMNNFQLNSQIDMMTNQALYQKQIMYMNSPTSPWMVAPYFQGNYFATAGSSTSVLGTQGFNFSK